MHLEFDCRQPVANVNVNQRARLPAYRFKIVVQLYKKGATPIYHCEAAWFSKCRKASSLPHEEVTK